MLNFNFANLSDSFTLGENVRGNYIEYYAWWTDAQQSDAGRLLSDLVIDTLEVKVKWFSCHIQFYYTRCQLHIRNVYEHLRLSAFTRMKDREKGEVIRLIQMSARLEITELRDVDTTMGSI